MNKGKKLLLLIGLAVAAAIAVAVFWEPWMGLVVLLASGLLGFTGKIGIRTLNAHYNPMVEGSGRNVNADRKSHPEDIPLNPWDTITGNGEKSE